MTQARSTSIARLLLLAAVAPAAAAAPHELYQLSHLQGGTAQGIHFISPQEGWTAEDGGRIRHWTLDPTTGSWNSELQKTPYDCRFLLRDVFFADPLNGWAVGYGGRVLRTRDGGNFWDNAASTTQLFVHLPGRPELADLYSVHFFFDPTINDWRGWLTGFGGVLMRSDDGGYSWQDTLPPHLAGLDIYAIEVHPTGPYGSTVWVTADQGRVLSSNDLGATWSEQQLRGTPLVTGNLELWDVALRPDGSGCVVGGYGRGTGQVFHTTDFGANWTFEDCFLAGSGEPMLTMYGVSLTGTSAAVSGGYGDQMALRETDCWREQALNAHSVGNPAVLGVSGLGDGHVWMCGDFNNIRTTSDSGRTWSYVSKGLPLRLHTGTFLTTRVGFVAGQLAQILKTTDGGETWNTKYPKVITGGVQIISSLEFSALDSAHGVGVGRAPDGTLLVVWTDDEGETWNEVPTLPVTVKGCLNDVAFDPSNASKVWAVGNKGLVLQSDDGGATWRTRSLPQTKGRTNLQGVCVDGADRVFVVGSDPDGRESGAWMLEDDTWKTLWLFDADGKEFEVDLHDVAASPLGVFAVGTGGSVLRLETDGSFHAMFRPDNSSPLYNPAETLTQVGAFDSTRCESLWIGGADGSLTVFDGTSWTSPKSGMSETPVLGISLVDTPHGCVGYLIGRYFEVIRLARSDV